MNNKSFFLTTLAALMLLGTLLPGSFGCRMTSTFWEDENSRNLQLATYRNAILPYSLDYPSGLMPDDENNGTVFFRSDRGVPLVVRYHDEAEGKRRGAWFEYEPVGETELAGRKGQKYIYDHWEGPFHTRTIAYVIAYRGKFLGLEFRTPGELTEIQKQIVESFMIAE